MKIRKVYRNENLYSTRNWNREEATRYVIEVDEGVVEASHFAHFNNHEFVKDVIEIPTSFGCPIGCKHCASALLKDTRLLTKKQLVKINRYIADENGISSEDHFLVTYSGIGEGSISPRRVIDASHEIYSTYKESYYTFTTVGLNPSYIRKIDRLSEDIPIHYLQVSLISPKEKVVKNIIPTYDSINYSIENLLEEISKVENITVRCNVVLIKNCNDDVQDWVKLSKKMDGLQDRVVWRISELNRTNASIKNDLVPADKDKLFEVRDVFRKNGFKSYVFMSHEDDNLNCGQLAWGEYDYKTTE